MRSYSHWGMFHCWEAPGLPPMVEQPKSWMHVDIGSPYPIAHYTLAEAHEGDSIAIREVFDRVEGKATQPISNDENGTFVVSWQART